MNKVAIGYLTKDRVELTRQTVPRLLGIPDLDVWWFDGSRTPDGEAEFGYHSGVHKYLANVRGGADAAIVCALTHMLDAGYEYVGLCENDVLLPPGWFESTMQLFKRGAREGLGVGAVSPRAYVDRVLFQRDGYAAMHNLGAGVVIFSRAAAEVVLAHYRSSWTTENRLVFGQLSGVDIGTYWAFRASENFLTADWGFDRALASKGYASLALTPSHVEMIGQNLEEQGLQIVKEPVGLRRDPKGFDRFCDRIAVLGWGHMDSSVGPVLRDPGGALMPFAHQLGMIGAERTGDWSFKWSQAFGPFAYVAGKDAALSVELAGPVEILASGGKAGAKIEVVSDSGFVAAPVMPPEDGQRVPQIMVPGFYRPQRLDVWFAPGAVLYGMRVSLPPLLRSSGWRFDFDRLPPVQE